MKSIFGFAVFSAIAICVVYSERYSEVWEKTIRNVVEVDGGVGEGMRIWRHSTHMGSVDYIENGNACCQECKKKFNNTEMFNYYSLEKRCTCLKRDSDKNPECSKGVKNIVSGICAKPSWESTIDVDVTPNLKVEIYKSNLTGLTVALGKADSPIVQGFFCLATETHNDEGLPHTLEHLVFMGSTSYPYKGVLDLLANRCFADRTNAWTGSDHTCYTVSTAGTDGFMKILPVFMDHILHPTLNDGDYRTEVYSINGEGEDVGVVYGEMQGIESTPERTLLRKTLELLFPEYSGYRRETGGVLKSLRDSTSNSKVKAYHKKYYRPENLFLTITGNVEAKEVFNALNVVEDKWLKNKPTDIPDFEKPWQDTSLSPFLPANEMTYEYGSSDETSGYVIIAWRMNSSITENVEDLLAQKYLLDFLTLPEIGPLDEAMVSTDEPLATSIKVEQENFREPVFILTFSNVPVQNLEDVAPKLDEIMRQIIQHDNIFNETYLPMIHSVIEQDLLQVKKDKENTPQTFVPPITSIFQLYGETKKDFKNLIEKELRIPSLKNESSDFWMNTLKKSFIESTKVVLRGKPSGELLKNKIEIEENRINKRNESLNHEDLKRIEKKDIANQKSPPAEVLLKIPLADVNQIKFRPIEICDSAHCNLNFEIETFPFNISVINVTSSFVQLYIFMDTGSLTLKQKKMLPLLLDLWTYSRVSKNGTIIPQDEVLQNRDKNILGFYADFGFYDEYSEAIVFEAQCQLDKLDLALDNIRDTLLFADPTAEDVDISIENKLYSLPEIKQSPSDVEYAIYDALSFKKNSNTYLRTFFIQESFLENLMTEDSNSTVNDLKEIMGIVTNSKNAFVYIATDADKLITEQENAFMKLKTLFHETTDEANHPNLEIKYDFDLKSDLSEDFCHIAIGMPETESCYLQKTVDINRNNLTDYEIAEMEVLLRYLSDRMYEKVRGRGLAYGVDFSFSVPRGHISLGLSRSPQVVDAVSVIQSLFSDYTKNITEWDQNLMDSAKGSIIFEKTRNEETVEDMIMEVSKALIRSNDKYHNRNLIKNLADVSIDDLSVVSKMYLPKLFNGNDSMSILICNSGNIKEVVEQLEEIPVMFEDNAGTSFHMFSNVDEFGGQISTSGLRSIFTKEGSGMFGWGGTL